MRDRSSNDRRSTTAEYKVWRGMKQRCLDKKSSSYRRYGSLGITVCDRWLETKGKGYENFLEDMGRRPSPKHSIDRIDNSIGYSPENCHWATLKEQANNKRTTPIVMFRGQLMTAMQISEILSIKPGTIRERIRNNRTIDKQLHKEGLL